MGAVGHAVGHVATVFAGVATNAFAHIMSAAAPVFDQLGRIPVVGHLLEEGALRAQVLAADTALAGLRLAMDKAHRDILTAGGSDVFLTGAVGHELDSIELIYNTGVQQKHDLEVRLNSL